MLCGALQWLRHGPVVLIVCWCGRGEGEGEMRGRSHGGDRETLTVQNFIHTDGIMK